MRLSPMGDNRSPPEDASQNQNYQQLVFFAIPGRILPVYTYGCVGLRTRMCWPTQAAA